MDKHSPLIHEMVQYETGSPSRIQHFIKVLSFASLIAEGEKLNEKTRFILETAAIVHDIGIKKSKELYGDGNGKHQEELGPDIARPMLAKLSYDPPIVDRVCYLIAHHHTYTDIDGLDYQILVEADFLVNLYENHTAPEKIQSILQKIFRTTTGTHLCRTMFGITE